MGQPAEDMANYTSLEDMAEKQTDEVQPEGKVVDDMQAPEAVQEDQEEVESNETADDAAEEVAE